LTLSGGRAYDARDHVLSPSRPHAAAPVHAAVMGTLPVRARIAPGPAPGLERLHDPLLDDLVHDGPLARERFATRWSDDGALRALAAAKRAPLAAPLAAELADYHRRLGASEASLAALDRLARGAAVCAVSGQQPAPLGGPLYSLHKIATSVGLCAAVEARTGVPCVPLFWMHGEDSDFAEIRGALVADSELTVHELQLPAEIHREGQMVGGLPVTALAPLEARALEIWAGLPGAAEARGTLTAAAARARDLGEAMSALVLALFAARGVVVVDPRLPGVRAAARPLIEHYLAKPDELGRAARTAGERLSSTIGRRPLADAALDSFVFAIQDGVRRKVTPAEARAPGAGTALVPSVALRPVVQDALFPTVAMACGPGEAAYLAQLREVFEGLGVRAAAPVPRLSATWLPPAAGALLEAAGAEPAELLASPDALLKRVAERKVPGEVRAALEGARAAALEGLARLAESSKRVDASLPQMVESARGKVEYQFARIEEGLAGKVRHQLERQHPEWPRLRYFLLPGDKLQERRLASLEVVARRGPGAVGELCELAGEQARRIGAGALEHLVIDL